MNTCGGVFGHEVRRGVFIDKYLFSISYGGVSVSDVTDGVLKPDAVNSLRFEIQKHLTFSTVKMTLTRHRTGRARLRQRALVRSNLG